MSKAALASEEKQNEQNDSKSKLNKIVILYAMEEEAKPSIKHMKLEEDKKLSSEMDPSKVYTTNDSDSLLLVTIGKHPKHNCDLVSTQWASITCYNIIRKLKPDIIINAGTCGGVLYGNEVGKNKSKIDIGAVFIGEKCLYSDRIIPFEPWKGWDQGNYKLFGHKYLSKELELQKGTISSSNSFLHNKDEKKLYVDKNVVCKDMEVAAIADVCDVFGVPLIALKGITDIVRNSDATDVGHDTAAVQDFQTNLVMTVKKLKIYLAKTVSLIKGKELNQIDSQWKKQN